ncbi:MAG: hypothetical protein SLAVMIC_00134 [uncultured marine phage]|uniref:Uncharacterized protein n=1 Tax=uncultured marine phage TaxID=707152 RepID=A0A8D9FRA9_9VIRU|nr:MAG: hypothetical protein SLAVMIC_00134 [uncultured marine phage]
MKLKRYSQFITEGLGDDNVEKFTEYESLKQDLLNMIEESVNSNEMNLVNEFIDSYINDPESTNIEGLVNDSDVYEFYLKYVNEIDEVLNSVEYFSKSPESEGSLGLYDSLVNGTRTALEELFKMIKKDLSGGTEDFETKEETTEF